MLVTIRIFIFSVFLDLTFWTNKLKMILIKNRGKSLEPLLACDNVALSYVKFKTEIQISVISFKDKYRSYKH